MTATQTAPAAPITLYRLALSGHAHRADLALSLMGLPHRLVDVDLKGASTSSPPSCA